MPSVTYDGRSLMVDGRRVWLVSGSVHYFRTPGALWWDRLLKAKRAGLNCVSTFVAWNLHEPQEGRWQFEGDRDIVQFVRQAGELGLYVILRPGPYFDGDWDFGGLPGWLSGKSGMSCRAGGAAYTHYLDKYFARVLPRLAEFQVPRGGNIILIQNENDYRMTTMPDRLNHLQFVSQLFRRAGFEVPILTCNAFTDPPLPEAVDSVAARGSPVALLNRLRMRQPNAPLLVAELHCGGPDAWAGERRRTGPRDPACRALGALGCGAQFNYYMWHGGTNFGFWGGRLPAAQGRYQTTSYDYDAPVAESGGLTEKYYLTRLVNVLASTLGPSFATCAMDAPSARACDVCDVLNISGPKGRWVVVTNNGRHEVTAATIGLPEGGELTVSLEPLGATAVPIGVALTVSHVIDYSTLMPFGFFGERILVLHGPAGWRGRISINGNVLAATVPNGDNVQVSEHESLQIVVVNSELAAHTWEVDGCLVFGPDFVGETIEDIRTPKGARHYSVLPFDGQLARKRASTTKPASLTAPRLRTWHRAVVCAEPGEADLAWQKLDRPRDVDRLGVHYGYAWYKFDLQEPRQRHCQLFLPQCEDRATVYINDRLLGVWGRGPGATRRPMAATMNRGLNRIVLLVDNLGRFSNGPNLGELKGLYGHVYSAKPLRTPKFKVRPADGFPRRIIPRGQAHLIDALQGQAVWQADVAISLKSVIPLHLSVADVPHHFAAFCNGRLGGFFPMTETNFADLTLGAELRQGSNEIRLLLWGDVDPKVLDNVTFYALEHCLSDNGSLAWRPWTELPPKEPRRTGKGWPAWFAASFRHTGVDEPLFLRIAGAKKGQIYINGRNAGRFWKVGPQEHYYLPSCWLAEENELVLFEEQGNTPTGTRLVYLPNGPYRD